MDNITENNKLIAEFMGIYFKNNEYQIDNENLRWMVISANSWLNDLEEQDFDFHSSWDWLMPVVEKIESLNLGNTTIKTVFSEEDLYINSNVSFLIMHKECYVNFFGEMKVYENWISVTECNSKIEAVYNACVEFIKWYNEQNKK